VQDYCNKVEHDLWGGNLEIIAISLALRLNVEVIRAEGQENIFRSDGLVT
jgi:hypothetical protein